MANRLIRVRHMSMPEGLDAFTWRISEDHVVLYANTLIGHFARVKASRMALHAANVRRRYLVMLWPIMLWAALRHGYKAHSSAVNTVGVGAGVLGVIVAVALLLLSGTSKAPTHAGPSPIAAGNPSPSPAPKASCHTLVNSHGSKQVACNGKARGIVRRHGLTPPPWSHGRKHHHKHHG